MRKIHGELVRALEGFSLVFCTENKEKKLAHAKAVLEVLKNLRGVFAVPDLPAWYGPVENAFRNYVQHGQAEKHAVTIFNLLAKHLAEIRATDWIEVALRTGNNENFDKIFERSWHDSNLDELFVRLTRSIEKIIETDEVDSRKILKELERLLNIVRGMNQGSYFSVICTSQFINAFLKNFAFEELDKVPVLGSASKAFKKTLEEISTKSQMLQDSVGQELKEEYLIPGPTDKDIKSVTFEKRKALPAPEKQENQS
ncbi:hypothetical protein [Emcibacter sp.]|uniref:hypothetical protein n=1 Tax=Emcibacter sp. TaxID=1979954 RepID=UPI002AA8D894|nr:hypothetical protein [Emcibacter sp.]